MGETGGIFTLKTQFNPWGSIFGADKSHAEELSVRLILISKDLRTTLYWKSINGM